MVFVLSTTQTLNDERKNCVVFQSTAEQGFTMLHCHCEMYGLDFLLFSVLKIARRARTPKH